jgi:hypothetical protein
MQSRALFFSILAMLSLSNANAESPPKLDRAIRYPGQSNRAAAPVSNLVSRMSEFMVVRAKDHPEWWTDVKPYTDENQPIPAGYIVIQSARGPLLTRVLGWTDLPPDQQKAVIEDPYWQAFLRAKRDKKLYPGSSSIYANDGHTGESAPIIGITPTEQPTVYAVTFDPAELIRRRPTEVRLDGKRDSTQ